VRIPRLTVNGRVGVMFAVLAYLPMLFTQPGQVSADTKTYLTLDPGRLMSRAWSMWDPMVGAGTVTHQNIGFLFPLGPVYWGADWVGLPGWVTQRLIWGTILWAAAYGTWKLCRWMGWSILPAVIAAIAYGWSPYLLSYLARLSVILMPWAALPWLILFAAMAVRESRWRAPAMFALVIALVGSVNATSLLLVGIGPVLWVLAEWGNGRHRSTAVLAGGTRTLVLTLGVSVWWVLGLRIQGAYGLPILDYTETYQVVAASSTPQEILRGLGYWFFYGGDRLGPWVGPSGVYRSPWMIAVGTILAAVSLLGLCSAFVGRTRALLLLVVGLALAVGAAPLGASTPYGEVFGRLTASTVGMALRSTPRAAPLVILAMALGLGAAVQWLRLRSMDLNRSDRTGPIESRWPQWARVMILPASVTVILVGLIVQIHPVLFGRTLTDGILRPSALPSYRYDLADWLEATGQGRVWEIPGSDFASYRWGGTVDPVLPGMIDRPTLARELVPQGGAGTINLLAALDTRFQEGTFEPSSLRQVARLFGVETIVMRNDLQHERHRLIRPGTLWPQLLAALGEPDFIGPMTTDQPVIPMVDEIYLADPIRAEEYPIVAAWNLGGETGVPPVIGSQPASALVIAGDGEAVVDLAAAGLIDRERPILYAASNIDPAQWGPDPHLVVTDTNAKRARRWSTLGAHSGVIETVDEVAVTNDPGDQRLALFADDSTDFGRTARSPQTVMVHTGPVTAARATSYGNPFSHTPEDAPHYAIDGDPLTAWRTGVFSDLRGQRLEIELAEPVVADHLWILQPTTRVTTRYLTEIALRFDDGAAIRVPLDETSRSEPGQRIGIPEPFAQIPFHKVSVELLADNLGRARIFTAQPGAGIAEIRIGDLRADPTVQMPTSWLSGVTDLSDRALDLVMTRLRIDPATPNREDPELRLDRSFDLPISQRFTLQGTARIAASASDERVFAAITPGQRADVVAFDRMTGSVHTWGRAAFDGDPDTAWITGFELGQTRDLAVATVTVTRPVDTAWGDLRLGWRSDPDYSRPTQITVRAADQPDRIMELSTGRVFEDVLDLSGLLSDRLEIQISAMEARVSPDYISGVPRVLPIAITEIELRDIDGVSVMVDSLPLRISEQCRTDLLQIDGSPVGVRLKSDAVDALQRGPIGIELCGGPLDLGPGTHRVVAAPGRQTGVDLDRIVLRSVRSDVAIGSGFITEGDRLTPLEFERLSPHRFNVTWPAGAAGTMGGWLILRESWNAGWEARIDDGPSQSPLLIDGFANGWWLEAHTEPRQIIIEWTPQRMIGPGLILSALFLVVILTLVCVSGWGRGRSPWPVHDSAVTQHESDQVRVARGHPVMTDIAVMGAATFAGGPIAGVTYLLVRWLGRDRPWLAPASAFGLWGVSALYTAALQFGFSYPADPDWPTRFAFMSPLVWAAVAAVLAARPVASRVLA
jgi:arabinofuranan 3-O-arabinosyltransferase